MSSQMASLVDNERVPEHLLLVNQIENEVNVALFRAAEAGNPQEVLKCIKNGGKPNFFYKPSDSKNALHIAAEKGYVDVAKVLLANGAVADCLAGADKSTALILASHHNNLEMLKILVEAGANVNAGNGYGNTPLHEACHHRNLEVSSFLIKHGANVLATNHKGSTPLHTLCYAIKSYHGMDLLKLLIQSGADVNLPDARGNTPFLVCCSSGRMDFIQHLIECGADPTVRNHQGQDAEAVAIFYEHPDVAAHFHRDSPAKRFAN